MNLKEAEQKIAELERQLKDMTDESYFNQNEIVIGNITIRDEDYEITFDKRYGGSDYHPAFRIGKKFNWDKLFKWIKYRKHLRKTNPESYFTSEAPDENA